MTGGSRPGSSSPTGAGSLEEMPRLWANPWSRTEKTRRDLHRAKHRTDGEEYGFFFVGREYESTAYLLLPHVQIPCHAGRYLPCPLALLQQKVVRVEPQDCQLRPSCSCYIHISAKAAGDRATWNNQITFNLVQIRNGALNRIK